MDERSQMLANEKISKLLLKLSVPAMVGMLVQAFYNLVDTIFVGHAYGVDSIQAIGGIAVAFPIQMVGMAVSLAIGIGGSSIISRRMGEMEMEKANKTFSNLIFLSILSSLLITGVGITFIVPLLKLFGATDTILPYSLEYLEVILYGTILFSLAMVTNSVARSEGNAKVAMNSMMMAGGLNIILDPVFIFGFGMGIRGAAIATVLAQGIGVLYISRYFLSGKSTLRFHPADLKPEGKIIKEVLAIGASPFARNVSSSFMVIILNNLLAFYGGDIAIAIFGIISKLLMFTLMPMFGIIQGLQPIVGFNYGAKNFERVRESVKLAIIITTGMSIAGFLVLYLFPEQLFGIFSGDHQLIVEGKNAVRIVVLATPLIGFQVVGGALYQALGKARPSLFLSMCRQVLFLIPLVLILPKYLDLSGVWAAFPLADTLAFAVTLIMVIREFKLLAENGENMRNDPLRNDPLAGN
ncbi:Multi antimicrobial extrusion protein (Na(+)/drug antiporter), MATE family of MDR efflux pumps [Methanosarcina siciliae C2J]|uniref:Multidrug export protein MepA n=1 Tax=Methanosarcina siciliae C2J TaxID=1434118 RepID=A0A0E3PJR8_9EURY|nr:MATE family efflux transporter [Methanosarcina siciliae]AKB34910.1 Multi antimicrobial extrusion protein (Na(+)/drug antiporter), MATE family of MDR efflux pumps [Methanosarcina siciliae C2J]